MKKTIGIIGALNEEIEEIKSRLDITDKTSIGHTTYFTKKHKDIQIVLTKTGVGKVFSAMITQHLIDHFSPDIVIFTGVAGSINPNINIGDIVIAEKCVQYDLDVTELGFEIGSIPYTTYRYFESDKNLVELALKTQNKDTIKKGTVLTGDMFITDKNFKKHNDNFIKLKGDIIEMEGASVGQVCTINNTPFLIVRTISDKADNSAKVNFTSLLPVVAKNSYDIINHLLNNI
ncbi:MAG TPA: 5'-methylthioadenosine/adenosylhomocysteine nucleosidase [Candidatus Dojkabacteria bacterium]|nr:5'-methylthioadenosine/adenosylhomocysteine nucleosidase [Candidatus Dojkabacteria bacterium]